MPEGAVMEAPIAAPAATSESVSSPISEAPESTQSTELESTETPESTGESLETQAKPGVRADLSSVLKDPAKREALKAIDPSLPGLLRDAAFGAQQIKKEFPQGGLKEAIQYRDVIKQNGGLQGIQDVKQSVQDYDNLDQLYTEGKPEFVQQIAQGDPDAFERMVPLAIEQFSKQSPEQYQHVMSKVLINTLDSAGFPQILQELYKTGTDEAKALIQQAWDKIEGYRGLASKIPEKKVDPERQKLETEKQTWAQQKMQDVEAGVNRRSVEHRDSLIAKELKPFANWQDLDDDRKSAIIREVRARTAKLVNADEGWKNQRQRLLQNGDAEGVARLEKQFLDEQIPNIVPRVAKLFWSNPGKPTAKPGIQTNKPAVIAPKGFQMMKSAPDSNKIDRRATTRDMVMNNQAILVGGQKVQWA